MSKSFIDADGCSGKQELYLGAKPYGLKVASVSNSRRPTLQEDRLEAAAGVGQFSAANDWISRPIGENDSWITGENMGEALSARELLSLFRDPVTPAGGRAPFEKQNRARLR